MAIKEYIHGSGTDYQLWGNVGRFLVDRGVQEKMGNCISSEPGDIWWVALTHNSKTTGFACARLMKNKTLHLRYFYVAEQNPLDLGEENLINKAIKHAEANGCSAVYTNWRKESPVMEKLGFKSTPRAKGDFCRWELELKG